MGINLRRAIIATILLGPLVVAGTVYFGLVFDGTIEPLDLRALSQALVPAVTGSISVALGLAIIGVVSCAAIAPVIYAARSGDVLTVLISLVLTTLAIAVFVTAKSAIQEILAVLIYLANIVLSATMYAAHHIVHARE